MIMSYIANQYETSILRLELTHQQIVHILETPKDGVDKDKLPQWQAISLKPKSDEERNQENYEASLKPKNDGMRNHKNYAGERNQKNYDAVHAVFLDYDGHMQIEEFQALCPYGYYLYTTSSHTDEKHKFRVIVPLAEPIPWDVYHHRVTKDYLTALFQVQDLTCYSNWHKTPTIPRDGKSMYRYGAFGGDGALDLTVDSDEGKHLAMLMAEHVQAQAEAEEKRKEKRKKNTHNNPAGFIAYIKNKAIRDLDAIPDRTTGDRYRTACSVIGKYINVEHPQTGVFVFDTAEDFKDITPRHLLCHDSIVKAIDSFYGKR